MTGRIGSEYQDIQNKPLPAPPSSSVPTTSGNSSATYNPPHYADNAGYDIAQTLRVVDTSAGYSTSYPTPGSGARKESSVSIPYMVPVGGSLDRPPHGAAAGYQVPDNSHVEDDDHTYEQLPADLKFNYS